MSDRRSQLESVIQTAIDSSLKELHTMLPAVVTSVDNSNQLIDAQITIKRKMSGELVLLPLLKNVPIRFPKSKTFSITFPIEIDDHVMVIFCERSIDVWLTEGDIKNPFDFRKFSLSDAFAIPSMYPQTDLIPNFDSSNLEIKTNSGDTKVIVKGSEDVEVTTTGEIKGQCDTAVLNATTSITTTTPIYTLNGNMQINGNLIVTGIISCPTIQATSSLTIVGKEMNGHTHAQGIDSGGDTQQNTGGPV